MSNLWFTADTHFGHTNIIKHSRRPFTSIEEMDEALIANWNAVVRSNDDVWHLGDFNFRSKLKTADYRARLNGRVHFVKGNHDDKDAWPARAVFTSAQEVKYLRVNNQKLYLSHYAHRVWRNSHHGSWHLYGHSHGSLPSYGRSLDVGVDARGYTPVSFDELAVWMDQQPVTLHHPDGSLVNA